MKRVYAVGTADTKPEELAFVAALLRARLGAVCTVDLAIPRAANDLRYPQ